MAHILTVRIGPGVLAKAEARAAQLGLDRACYFRSLIERDVENGIATPRRRFASEDLVGQFYSHCKVWAVDRDDFTAYRRHGRQAVACEFSTRRMSRIAI